jgi:hypothetical protein
MSRSCLSGGAENLAVEGEEDVNPYQLLGSATYLADRKIE